MDFTLSDEQKMLRDGAERYLAENYGFHQRKALLASDGGCSEAQWRQFADMGWLALPIPETCGGLGGSFVDISLLQESMGARLVVEPFATTSILAAFLLAGCSNAEMRSTELRRVAEGEMRVALAHGEDESRYELDKVTTRAVPSSKGFYLTGRKTNVWNAPSAHKLIVSAVIEGDSAFSLFLMARSAQGVVERSYPLIDSTRASDFEFTGAPGALLIPAESALHRLEEAFDRMVLAQVAESVGIMEKVLEITAEQLRNRTQFGQTLSKFQALQHRAAEMFVEIQEARSILYRGIAMIESPAEERQSAVSAAKVVAFGAARIVGAQGIQLHGGVGMTDEYAVGHHFKRLLALEKQYGDINYHVKRFAKTYGKGDDSR